MIPKRLYIALMLFLGSFTELMQRVNFSIIIISASTNNTQTARDRFCVWPADNLGVLLGAYYHGFIISSALAGFIIPRGSAKNIAALSMFSAALISLLMPITGTCNEVFVFMIRLSLGIAGGFMIPTCHNVISQWSPPAERGRFVSAFLGGPFGIVVTWLVSGHVLEQFGWRWAFYIVAMATLMFVALWLYVVTDQPSKYSTITPEELKYIEDSLGETVTHTNLTVPVKAILMSLPFWALMLLQFGGMYGILLLIAYGPRYFNGVLGYGVSTTGSLAAMPYLGKMMFGFLFGFLDDLVRSKNLLTITECRKACCIFSHILPGVFFIILGFTRRPPLCVIYVTLALSFSGAAVTTFIANPQDLSPNYAGTVSGFATCFGFIPGIVSPLLVAHFTEYENNFEQWQNIFHITAAIFIFPSIFFWIYGSGNIQDWNYN